MHDELVPPSVDLLESMRSVGYSLSAALADLIDNSIAAGASSIEIDADIVGGSYVAVLDNGSGMSEKEAREALRLAGTARNERGDGDLGRFGLGLKTASMSQARRLTVCYLRGVELEGLRWDLNHVEATRKWSLQVLDSDEAAALPNASQLRDAGAGTLVLWEDLDLLVGDSPDPGRAVRERLALAITDLELTFHRFLAGPGATTISVNGTSLKPRDPFLTKNTRTQISPVETILVEGLPVSVTAYTLPHASGLSAAERRRDDLSGGMREAQGFYIYRNRRLISHGDWFRLASRSELSKQTRIQVDVPVGLDHLWRLDIKKQRTDPPASFRAQLQRLIEPVLEKGRRVHKFRGRQTSAKTIEHVWNRMETRDSTVFYEVNRSHPVYEALRSTLSPTEASLLEALMHLVSENFPSQDLYLHMADNQAATLTPATESKILSDLEKLARAGLLEGPTEACVAMLSNAEPFTSALDLFSLVAQAKENLTNAAQ